MTEGIDFLLNDTLLSDDLKDIVEKVKNNVRITEEECVLLYKKGELNLVGVLANFIKNRLHGDEVYFNKNIHIEPTNICTYNCKFCSYSRKEGEEGSWDYSIEEMIDMINVHPKGSITEVHIVGGVHPEKDIHHYAQLVSSIREERPELHIKGFTAVEIDYMSKKAGFYVKEGLQKLQRAGLDSIPGGGAEIFDDKIREEICGSKSKSAQWLKVHETAHTLEVQSNATMLYGHIESFEQRVMHMNKLRELQDRTGGFNTFIPLKFNRSENELSHIEELSSIEDLRNYSIARIFLDNIPHLKAYWPMIGRDTAFASLEYGVDDLDGTINDTTKIYSMAGADEQNPSMGSEEIVELIQRHGKIAVERDSLYKKITVY